MKRFYYKEKGDDVVVLPYTHCKKMRWQLKDLIDKSETPTNIQVTELNEYGLMTMSAYDI